MRNEHTSARVAKIAAKVLAMDVTELLAWWNRPFAVVRRDIRAMAASCLTQAPDKPKKRVPSVPHAGVRKPPRKVIDRKTGLSNYIERGKHHSSPFYPAATSKRRSP